MNNAIFIQTYCLFIWPMYIRLRVIVYTTTTSEEKTGNIANHIKYLYTKYTTCLCNKYMIMTRFHDNKSDSTTTHVLAQ